MNGIWVRGHRAVDSPSGRCMVDSAAERTTWRNTVSSQGVLFARRMWYHTKLVDSTALCCALCNGLASPIWGSGFGNRAEWALPRWI
jgi:hypothetical protein